MGSRLVVTLLGRFALTGPDGAPVALPTRKAEAVLAVLAAEAPRPMAREQLAALLWPDSADAQARASLRQSLAMIRRAVGEEAVIATSNEMRLEAEVDVAAFAAAVAAGRWAEAAAAWTGDFLDAFTVETEPFDAWRRAVATRLRGQAMQVLERLTADDDAVALALGQRLVAADPLAEAAHRALMRLHLARGRRAEALRQYQLCAETLQAELGVAPAAETQALRRQASAVAADPQAPPAIAVLPFANLSSDPEQAYFAEGFADDLRRELSRFRPLAVIARTSAYSPTLAGLTPQQQGERLGTGYLLTGSVRRGGDAVRLNLALVEAATARQLWAERYDLASVDLLRVQDEIVGRVASALALRIDEQILRRTRGRSDENLAAYDCWLRGMEHLQRGSYEELERARALFQRALAADPSYARAHAGISLSHFNDWTCNAWDRWDENEARALEYATRALALDDGDHVTQYIMARVLLYRHDYARAVEHLERAEQINCNDADMLAWMALAYGYLGEAERGIAAGRAAVRLNPLHQPWYCFFIATAHFVGRELEPALALMERTPDGFADVRAYMTAALAQQGRIPEARRQLALFLEQFRNRIAFGAPFAADDPWRWLMRVNPFKRPADAAFFTKGLALAGLMVPAEARLLAG